MWPTDHYWRGLPMGHNKGSLCKQQLEVEQPQRLGEKGVEDENKHMQQLAVDENLLDLWRV